MERGISPCLQDKKAATISTANKLPSLLREL